MRPTVALLLVVVVAAACANIREAWEDGFARPAKVEVKRRVGIRIEPVDGPPVPMARLLAQSLASELEGLHVTTLVGGEGDSRFVLRGHAERNSDDRRIPFIVVIKWQLLDETGGAVGEHVQGVEGTWWQWEYGDPRILRSVGMGAAKPIAQLARLEEPATPPGAPQTANLMVDSVTGAPGDGNDALAHALKEAARSAGIALTDLPDVATHLLYGEVTATLPRDGAQIVKIVWTMTTPDGREVGRATQENKIEAGALDAAWGRVAAVVARAATRGIEEILGRSQQIREVLPVVPPDRPLPAVPGRAPPPGQ